MKTTLTITFVLLFVFISSCDNNECLECPGPIEYVPIVEEQETIVKGNCLTLFAAVEAFAGDNGGYFPKSVASDSSLAGKTLIDYLPGGERLLNPFTGMKDQPVDTIPSSPGEIAFYGHRYFNVFRITGRGNEGIIFEDDNIDETEALVIQACLTLQEALILWRDDSDGHFPSAYNDENNEGKTVIDYLPGGVLMVNPFTGARTEPVFASAADVGQTGYVCVCDQYGNNIGYTITGVGYTAGDVIVTLACQ